MDVFVSPMDGIAGLETDYSFPSFFFEQYSRFRRVNLVLGKPGIEFPFQQPNWACEVNGPGLVYYLDARMFEIVGAIDVENFFFFAITVFFC